MNGGLEDEPQKISPRQILEDAGRQARKFQEELDYSGVIRDQAVEVFDGMDSGVAEALTDLVMARASRLGGYARVVAVPSLAEHTLIGLGINPLTRNGISAISLRNVEESLRVGLLRPDLGIAEQFKNP